MFDFSKRVYLTLGFLLVLVLVGAGINFSESMQQNYEKLSLDVEKNGKFIKWINKWKERFPQVEADTFKRVDKGEIISSTNPRYSFKTLDANELMAETEKIRKDKFSVVSPNKEAFVTFRKYFSEANLPEESFVYFYGARDGKLISGPIYECKKTKCYFDRPFFIDSDVFYLPEIQEKVYEEEPDRCKLERICVYEMFLHEFDLKKNFRYTYVSTQLLTDFHEVEEALNDL